MPAIVSVSASAPVRMADLGGWTDTWFAGHGRVLNVALAPGVEVRLSRVPGGEGVRIRAENFGDDYRYDPAGASRHPLIEAAIDAAAPPGAALSVAVRSAMPPGAGTGTSAAVVVALLAAFDRLTGVTRSPGELAAAAHALEVSRLRRQSGIQDQIAAAHGGVSFIEMPEYPRAIVTPVPLSAGLRAALERRLLLIFLGRAHHSSAVHLEVIASLEQGGGAPRALDRLRQAADEGRAALGAGDLDAFARALTANTEAQGALHPALVSPEARRVWDLARAQGATGWKVNGAGGDGGSLTLMMGAGARRRRLLAALDAAVHGARAIPFTLSHEGVQVEGREA